MDLITLTEEILNGKLHFLCSACESTVKQSRKNKFVNLFDIDSSTLISVVEVKPINIS